MPKSLKNRLVSYLERQYPLFVASGALQRLVAEKTTYTPRTTVRRLEELVEAGMLEVDYRKGHAWYRHIPQESPEALVEKSIRWFEQLV